MNNQKLYTILKEFEDEIRAVPTIDKTKEIFEFAKKFPTAHRGAFEINLNKESEFDFHLNYKNSDDLKELIDHLNQDSLKENNALQKVKLFVERWMDDYEGFNNNIQGIFLEYDYSKNEFNLPNIFIKLDIKSLSPKQREKLLKNICFTIKDEKFYKTYEGLFGKFIYNNAGYQLGYIGFMLPREEHLLRLNFHKVTPLNFQKFCLDIFGELKPKVEEWFYKTIDIVDTTIISCDFYEGKPLDKIGLELFFEKQPSSEPRWNDLLNIIEIDGFKKELLLHKWNKETIAVNEQKFPKILLQNKLGEKFIPDCFKQLISHVKLTISNEKIKETKGYLGIGAVTPKRYNKEIKEEKIDSIYDNGLKFLLNAQQQSGFWRDFQIFKGYSDQWTTAYIANILCELPKTKEIKNAIALSWSALKRTFRKGKGWGYNYYTPVDGDSTSWALLLASKVDGEFFEKNKHIINRFIIPGEGTTTYVDKKEIMEYINLTQNDSFLGWNSAHNCISGVTNQIPGIDLTNIIESRKEKEGFWKGYWWSDHSYATNQCCSSLKTYAKAPLEEDSGLFYKVLNASLNNSSINKKTLLSEIEEQQTTKGGWPGSAKIIVPMPNELLYNQNSNWEKLDVKGLFTTATILKFLAQEA